MMSRESRRSISGGRFRLARHAMHIDYHFLAAMLVKRSPTFNRSHADSMNILLLHEKMAVGVEGGMPQRMIYQKISLVASLAGLVLTF